MKLHLALGFANGEGTGIVDVGKSVKLHLAERDPQHHAWAKHGVDNGGYHLRILLSYHYYKDTDLDELFEKYFTRPYPDVIADSGAFSAASQGVNINITEYAEWIKRWRHLFVTYANLDVIGNAEATKGNQIKLEGMGLNPLPVFHTGSDFKYLAELIDSYQYIALGGMVPFMRFPKRIIPWLVRCFKMAKGRAVYHGFGSTAWKVMRDLPWYSVDSSSWGSGFRYGQVPIFNAARGKFMTINLGDVSDWRKHGRLVNSMGFDWRDFAYRERNDRAKICAISALSYMMAEKWLRKRHGEIYIPGGDSAPAGLRAHLVTAADPNNGSGAKGGNMSISALGQAGLGEAVSGGGVRLHLSDTSNGINYSDAQKGVRVHLADARPKSGGEIAAAQSGINIHLAEHSLDRGG